MLNKEAIQKVAAIKWPNEKRYVAEYSFGWIVYAENNYTDTYAVTEVDGVIVFTKK